MESTSKIRYSILIINPNTSTHMTDGLKPIIDRLNYSDVHFDYFTAPTGATVTDAGKHVEGIPSINCGDHASLSALHCFPHLESLIGQYDGFLVACYSAHPLVGMLQDAILSNRPKFALLDKNKQLKKKQYVMGIMEASIWASLALTTFFNFDRPATTALDRTVAGSMDFGIVTTADTWKEELTWAVRKMLLRGRGGGLDSDIQVEGFAGVETTGLTAAELHTIAQGEVSLRISDATKNLIEGASRPVTTICLGCAGMAGMDDAVREGCIRALGKEKGSQVRIIDGVSAGIGFLVSSCKAGF
ncbi:hypothetical protein FQN57_004402 [Myotisia sp. PD_48]|nr:hypothetical protein FQN57_004402 [Myotisia sp. PD_48]